MQRSYIRKPLSVLLSILMALSVFGGMAFTASAASSGNFGDLYWTLNDDGLLSFSGNGGIPDYGFDWTNMPIKKIIINDSVTALGDCAFRGCTALKEVVFESNPTLDWDAFGWCYALEKVTLPQDMETIAGGMFISCTSLKTIELPTALKKIESIAFSESGLESLTIPEGVEIEENAFKSCDSLTALILESSAPVSYERGAISTLGENVTVTVGEGCHYDRQARTEYKLTLKEGSEIPEWMSAEEADMFIQRAEWEFNNAIEEGKSEEEALAAANEELYPGMELELHKTEIEAYDHIFRTGDTCPEVFGAATLNVIRDEATQNVIDLINAIGTVEFTDECKEEIDAARTAYDALNDVQKTFADNYETLTIAEGQYAALQLAADMTAFETYKTEKKAAMDALLQEGDSEAVQSIVGLAKTQIEGFTYDESKTLDENKAALDTLVANVPNAVAEQRATDLYAAKIEFDHYKAEQKAAVEAMAQEGDSEAVAQIIADAAAAIDALIYDEFYTLAENKATVDTLANIADRLAAQRAADAAAAQLAADKAAFDAYKFNLVAAVQAMAQDGDSEAAAQIIADAAAAIALLDYDTAKTLDENKAAVDALADIADRLAAQRAADAAAAQLAADKAAFDDYKAEQKAAVQALAEEGDSAAAAQIIADAVAAIDALTYDETKTLDENKAAVDAPADIADRLAAQRAADAAAAALAEAKEAAKAAIRNHKNAADYREAEQAELADIIENACVAIDAATDTAAISVIRSATIALINEIKTDAQLTAEEKAAADQAAADEVAALIDAIGEVEYNDESKAKIDAARAAYDALTDDQKALVENVEDLTAAEARYSELKATAETPDDPEEPVEDGVCPICGKTHNGGIFDRLIGFIHSLIAIFRSMFSFNSSGC